MVSEDDVKIFFALATWKDLALHGRPPAGLNISEDANSTRTRTPLCALVNSLLVFLSARECARQRLRSVRRWQLLYSSETSTSKRLPRTHSQLSCLIHGSLGWREWGFYEVAASNALSRAGREFLLAYVFRSLHRWRLVVDEIADDARTSRVRRAFVAWAGTLAVSAKLKAKLAGIVDAYSSRRVARIVRPFLTQLALRQSFGVLVGRGTQARDRSACRRALEQWRMSFTSEAMLIRLITRVQWHRRDRLLRDGLSLWHAFLSGDSTQPRMAVSSSMMACLRSSWFRWSLAAADARSTQRALLQGARIFATAGLMRWSATATHARAHRAQEAESRRIVAGVRRRGCLRRWRGAAARSSVVAHTCSRAVLRRQSNAMGRWRMNLQDRPALLRSSWPVAPLTSSPGLPLPAYPSRRTRPT